MGILKNILKRFACNSNCTFNQESFHDNEYVNIDLSKYKLKIKDMKNIEKIIRKRPSINTYRHSIGNNFITEL